MSLSPEGKPREEMNEAAAVRPTPQYMECRQVPAKNEPRLNVQKTQGAQSTKPNMYDEKGYPSYHDKKLINWST